MPTLVRAFTKLGGTIVYNKPVALDQSSYRTEIENLLAARPQVIFTEIDPQTGATFLSELQQLHGLPGRHRCYPSGAVAQGGQQRDRRGGHGQVLRGDAAVRAAERPGLAGLQPVPAGIRVTGAQPGQWSNDRTR